MVTVVTLIAAVALFAIHEYMVAGGRTTKPVCVGARRALLLGLVLVAVALGARAQFTIRTPSLLKASPADPVAAELSGDPLLRGTLEAQRPDRPFPVGGSAEDVRSWQSHVAETLRNRSELSGELSSVSFRVLEQREIDGIRRTLLEFTSWDDTPIPAYVHQPSGATRGGGILVIPGHGRGIRATAGFEPEDYQHAIARELARQGYVTLSPELRGFGMLAPDGRPLHSAIAHAALDAGSFYKAIVARDLRVALTVLEQWEGVDPSRLAVAGTSLGAELAVFLAGMDSRPRVIISHSYGGAVGPVSVAEAAGDDARQRPHGCHTIPGINRVLHQEDWFRLLAPRPVQVVRGTQNVRPSPGVDAFKAAVSDGFRPFGARERFEFSIEVGRHEFFLEPAIRFLAKWL